LDIQGGITACKLGHWTFLVGHWTFKGASPRTFEQYFSYFCASFSKFWEAIIKNKSFGHRSFQIEIERLRFFWPAFCKGFFVLLILPLQERISR